MCSSQAFDNRLTDSHAKRRRQRKTERKTKQMERKCTTKKKNERGRKEAI